VRAPFPLQWPEGWKRTPSITRMTSRFGLGLAESRDHLRLELERLAAVNAMITSNLPIRSDGLPYANGRCDDPGIAVWFFLPNNGRFEERVFACDRWLSPAENMRAIGKTIEAMRGLDRWGASEVAERAMRGFAALPPGSSGSMPTGPRPWREVLGGTWPELDKLELLAIAKSRHRKLIAEAHPDAGGDVDRAAELNVAIAAAEAELAP
jgi:hypothetical protein